jgi:hypothetical protein
MRILLALLFVVFALYSHVWAQVSFPNTIQASFISNPIQLDGQLDEPEWQSANRISNFTQRELNFGESVSERTEVAVLYDKEKLYIGVWCYDRNPSAIIAKELKRDFNYEIDDNFIIVIDTYNDERNGFMFVTNPNAARADLQIFNNGGSLSAFWNGVWDVKTQRNNSGWFAEFEIPFYTFKYKTQTDIQQWGINFERNIRHKREQALWQGWSRNNRVQQVNQAGNLTGLEDLRNKSFVEVKPYAIGGGQRSGQGPVGTLANGGGDINYLLSPTYRINATFNTDFAQVEADQQQVNITRFPLFFPELREFFLEGDDYFNMGFGGNRIIPFYTRRIGLTDNLDPIPIIAGARLLGKEQNSTVGLMAIQTDEAEGQPSTNYTVGSWRQDVGAQSYIGGMSVNRMDRNHWHTTSGVNGRYRTVNFFNKNLELGGSYIRTHNSDTGFRNQAYAYRAFISYPNDKINAYASIQESPHDFNPEVGLMLRRNFRETYATLNFRPRPKNRLKWVRQFYFAPFTITNTQYNDTRTMQSFEYDLQYFGFETRKGERFILNYKIKGEGLIEDFRLAREIIIPSGEYWWREFEGEFRTFRGRTLSMSTRLIRGEFYTGTATRSISEVLWRAGKYLNTSVRYEINDIKLPYGNLQTHLIGNRIEYAISPNAFGSMLTQWNTAQQELNFNFRLHIIPKIGTDFFLIVNQLYDTRNQRFDSKRSTIIGKLIWRFTI